MNELEIESDYLLAVARGELEAGAVVFVATFEVISRAGYTIGWWSRITVLVSILVATTGFVIYRYRETRAMTLSQFFELRYSKSFRIFTGFLGFFAGIINFGIIPAVGARFIVYFIGLPPAVIIFSWSIPTYIPLMATFLLISLFITLSGGVITLMVIDCLEGMMSQIFYLIIIAALLFIFSWSDITEVLSNRPPGQSLINPFDSMGIKDFNIWYVMMGMFISVYGTMAWQNASAYNSAAISAHASVMGSILGRWREAGKGMCVTLLAICAVTFLHHPTFATQAATVHHVLDGISDAHVRSQMEVPVSLSNMLPMGIKGILCVVLLMGIFGGDATHLHSWGSIFVQDVLLPLRKKAFEPKQHIRALRYSIIGVAIFAFTFGSLFRQTEYIFMWWSITTAVYVGGAGSVLIGGLYWKKGTNSGAWVAMIAGSGLSVSGILARQAFGETFPLNGMEVSFAATLTAIFLYVLVSLLTCQENFDMDRLLHRGPYATKETVEGSVDNVKVDRRQCSIWEKLIGVDEKFSLSDKCIAVGLFGWNIFWLGVFLIGTIWNLISPWPIAAWSAYYFTTSICISTAVAALTTVWFTWGGLRDIRRLFQRLRVQQINPLDDGTVVGHQNLDECISPLTVNENAPDACTGASFKTQTPVTNKRL